MQGIHTTVRWPGTARKALLLLLVVLLHNTVGWSNEKKRPRAAPLTDQAVILQVKELLQSDPTFLGSMVDVASFRGQRTLLIPFKGSRGTSEDFQAFETAANLLMGLMAGGRAAVAAQQPIHTVTVLILGGAKNWAFQASVVNIGLLIAGIKSPEAFLQDNLRIVDLDRASKTE